MSNLSEYSKLYIIKNQDTGNIIYKYPYDKNKLVYAQRARAQKALADLLRLNPNINATIEEVSI